MTIFEVTESDGKVTLIDCESHGISAESGGPVVHTFAGITRHGDREVVEGVPLSWVFVAPESVREVPT